MTTKPPKSIQIGGKRIAVVVVTDADNWGTYNHDESKIRLSTMALINRKTMLATLRHEMIHAALHIGGVAYNEHNEEEAIVRCMDDVFFPAWERVRVKYDKS